MTAAQQAITANGFIESMLEECIRFRVLRFLRLVFHCASLADGTNIYSYGEQRIGEKQVGGGWLYHLGDSIESVRQISNSNSEIVLSQSFDPFGSGLMKVGDGSSSFQYAGEPMDPTGLIYLRARYLDAAVGRFISKDKADYDPIRPTWSNTFNYTHNNPINYTDPSGLCIHCQLGDRVKVDTREFQADGVLISSREASAVHAEPKPWSANVDYLTDNQYVTILSEPNNNTVNWGWRRVLLNSSSQPYPHVGWVRNRVLLDNCRGYSGRFGCIPMGNWNGRSFGFGPSAFAESHCASPSATSEDCPYLRTRRLHNGFDFMGPIGSPVIWPGTDLGLVLGINAILDARDNIVVE